MKQVNLLHGLIQEEACPVYRMMNLVIQEKNALSSDETSNSPARVNTTRGISVLPHDETNNPQKHSLPSDETSNPPSRVTSRRSKKHFFRIMNQQS